MASKLKLKGSPETVIKDFVAVEKFVDSFFL